MLNWGELLWLLCKEVDGPGLHYASRMTMLPFADTLTNIIATFVAFGSHSSLWPKATTFERSLCNHAKHCVIVDQPLS